MIIVKITREVVSNFILNKVQINIIIGTNWRPQCDNQTKSPIKMNRFSFSTQTSHYGFLNTLGCCPCLCHYWRTSNDREFAVCFNWKHRGIASPGITTTTNHPEAAGMHSRTSPDMRIQEQRHQSAGQPYLL